MAASRHAICAATLLTLPFDVRSDELEHRPRGVWWPCGTAPLISGQKKKKAAGEGRRGLHFRLARVIQLSAC